MRKREITLKIELILQNLTNSNKYPFISNHSYKIHSTLDRNNKYFILNLMFNLTLLILTNIHTTKIKDCQVNCNNLIKLIQWAKWRQWTWFKTSLIVHFRCSNNRLAINWLISVENKTWCLVKLQINSLMWSTNLFNSNKDHKCSLILSILKQIMLILT